MATEAVVLTKFRQKIAAFMAGTGTLAPAKYIVFGDGGHNSDGTVKPVSEVQDGLRHEILRKEMTSAYQDDLLSFTVKGDIDKNELVGSVISEVGIADAEGDIIGVKNYPPKVIGADERYGMLVRVRM